MMELLHAASQNILQPAILFFVIGLFSGAFRVDIGFPAAFGRLLALYLMMAIGFKGGAALSEQGVDLGILFALGAGVVLSAALPFVAFALLRRLTRINTVNAAAIAAHYGSVSVVTFAAAIEVAESAGLPYEGYLPAVLAVMETPAILSGLYIAYRLGKGGRRAHAAGGAVRSELLREVLLNASVVLLVGAFFVGFLSGARGLADVGPVFVDPFKGVLCLYLLDVGMTVAKRLAESEGLDRRLVLFGLYMPLVSAVFGLGVSAALGLSEGGTALMTVLAASASYIAVPAAMRIALPESNPALYTLLSLGVTFPFNIVLGIPLYFALAKMAAG